MARLDSLPGPVLQGICKVLGDASNGLTHKDITHKLSENHIAESGGTNKVERLLAALSSRQQTDGCANVIAGFVNSVMHPAAYAGNSSAFHERKERLNTVLGFAALEIRDDGQIHHISKVSTLAEAEARANLLRSKLVARNVHPDVLNACRSELLTEKNYFHAVLETSKSVRDKLRRISEMDGDGSAFVDATLMAGSKPYPNVALNRFTTESERNEQNGYANMIKGMFSAFRNPTAHESRKEWLVLEEDALDFLVFASMLHRKLDKAIKTPPLPLS